MLEYIKFFTGRVFSWGDGEDGKLGHGTCTMLEEPKLVSFRTTYQNSEITLNVQC